MRPEAHPHICHIYDNRARIETRIKLLQTGTRHSQEPASLMRRLISNVEVTTASAGEGDVAYPPVGVDRQSAHGYPGRVTQVPLTVRRWTRSEYDRLVELGMFEREPLELLGGQLIVAEPQSAYHASAIRTVDHALRAVLPAGWLVSAQLPVSLDDESEPEPDVFVVPGRPSDYRHAHPTRPVLAVEVAESSLAFDRRGKGSLYARAGIPDYWIVNLRERVLEVYREPGPDPAAPYGWAYRSAATLAPPASVALLAVTGVQVAVADLLP